MLEAADGLQQSLQRVASTAGASGTAAAAISRLEACRREAVGRDTASAVKPLRRGARRGAPRRSSSSGAVDELRDDVAGIAGQQAQLDAEVEAAESAAEQAAEGRERSRRCVARGRAYASPLRERPAAVAAAAFRLRAAAALAAAWPWGCWSAATVAGSGRRWVSSARCAALSGWRVAPTLRRLPHAGGRRREPAELAELRLRAGRAAGAWPTVPVAAITRRRFGPAGPRRSWPSG